MNKGWILKKEREKTKKKKKRHSVLLMLSVKGSSIISREMK